MLAPVRAVKQIGPVVLVVGMGITLLTNPGMALLGAVGIVGSSIAKLNDQTVPETKRRSLNRIWTMFGSYAAIMSLLCMISIVASFVLARPAFVGPVVFFTLLTCWLPLIAFIIRRRAN